MSRSHSRAVGAAGLHIPIYEQVSTNIEFERERDGCFWGKVVGKRRQVSALSKNVEVRPTVMHRPRYQTTS